MDRRIVFESVGRAIVEPLTPREPGAGEVALRSIVSLMSTGTEGICFWGDYEAGTHWDAWVKYPHYPGYCCVSHVSGVGEGVTGFKVGDLVVSRSSHASSHVEPVHRVFPVPADVEPETASWFGLMKIAAMGARVADYRLGASALLVGAGPIGQTSLRWAVSAGLRHVVALDSVPMRLELARKGGATAVIEASAADAKDAVLEAFGGLLPQVVLDTTGNPQAFEASLRLVRDHGRLVLIGDAGRPSQQRLTVDVIRRGLTIVGAHDSHEDPGWDSRKLIDLFFHQLTAGRIDMSGLNTHRFQPEDCQEAYETAKTRRGETMGILFDWAK